MLNGAEDNDPPETQLEVERGGSGRPPRPTAVGLAYFGELPWRRVAGSAVGFQMMWKNYCYLLSHYFKKMTRTDQEQLIVRICQVVVVASAAVVGCFFYPYVGSLAKVFAIPLFFCLSWCGATKVLSPIVITAYEDKLNAPD